MWLIALLLISQETPPAPPAPPATPPPADLGLPPATPKKPEIQTPEVILAAGRAEIAQGAYKAGIDKLEEVNKSERKPELMYEIAIAYSQWQGHCSDSIDWFDRFFEACQKCTDFQAAKDRHDLVRAACLVRIKVETEPTGAMISIDGFPIGTSPLDTTVIAGQHGFEAELSGFGGPAVGQTFLPGQENAVVKMALAPLPAFIELTNIDAQSTVTVSGVPATNPKMQVKPGKHVIEASRPGFATKTIEVFARRGETARVDVTMLPAKLTYRPYIYGTIIAGVGGLVTAGAFGLMVREAKADRKRAIEEQNAKEDDEYILDKDSDIQSRSIVAAVAGGIGGALGITALVLWLLEPGDVPPPVALSFTREGFVLSGEF